MEYQVNASHYPMGSHTPRRLVHLPVPACSLSEVDWFAHQNCMCNVVNALTGRVGLCVPRPREGRVQQLKLLARELGKKLGRVAPMPLDQVPLAFTGKKRARYQRGVDLYRFRGVNSGDARTKVFVKLEGVKFSLDKPNPDCRAIQFRGEVFTARLMSFLRPIEHRLYRFAGGGSFPKGPLIAKSMNPNQRAAVIRRKAEALPGCVMIELDASRFDAHVSIPLLEVESETWLESCPDPELRSLLEMQRNNKGRARVGDTRLSYRVKGGRMSGDANTAGGNCIIMCCMLTLFGQELGVKFDFICDGDDSVFFLEGDVTEEYITSFFKELGMEMKVDNKTKDWTKIHFCQCMPINRSDGWTMVRDPKKVISKTTVNWKYSDIKLRPKLVRTICTGELSLSYGIPILDPYFRRLKKIAERSMSQRSLRRGGGLLPSDYLGEYRLMRDLPRDWTVDRSCPITPQIRESFAESFGIPIGQQLAVEDAIERWDFDITQVGLNVTGVELARWLPPFPHPER